MAGIYLHIPFCKQACSYCDFYFVTRQTQRAQFVAALCKEIALQATFFEAGQQVQTLYFGGGTPSLLTPAELQAILGAIHAHFVVADDAEVTLEANPDDLTTEKLQAYKALAVNRLSIGVQSFDAGVLRFFHRAHTAEQAVQAVYLAQQTGFTNLSLDLIYHSTGLTLAAWQANLEQALTLGVQHLSCYGLTLEPGTRLGLQLAQGRLIPPSEEAFVAQYELLLQLATQAGFEAYEISNLALPGYQSRHNTAYWQRKPYLGLGPAAHSFQGNQRSWNPRNLTTYLSAMEKGVLATEAVELLNPVDVLNETLLTGLRTSQGVNLSAANLPAQLLNSWQATTQPIQLKLAAAGLLHRDGLCLSLTPKGRLVADRITAELFLEASQHPLPV